MIFCVWEQGYHIREFCEQKSHTRVSQNGTYTRLTRVRPILRDTRVISLIQKFTHVVSYKSNGQFTRNIRSYRQPVHNALM